MKNLSIQAFGGQSKAILLAIFEENSEWQRIYECDWGKTLMVKKEWNYTDNDVSKVRLLFTALEYFDSFNKT